MIEIIQPECDSKYILQTIEALQEPKNKLEYISDTLERCAIQKASTTKKKRGMTGYNCFVKVMVKKGQPFKEVVKSKAWRQLSDKNKASWKNLAKEGCPPRLWE